MVGFCKKDMYNQIERDRRGQDGDVKEAEKFLIRLRLKDPKLYWGHKVDCNGWLLHIFWCDGMSQIDYNIFGDVVAFDATYGRNKYKCPVVVFSGVNHHKQTCVFGCAVVSDEKKDTYIWVLQQFITTMKGKCPNRVITDGDISMRNAIRKVFPYAYHRLCGWHLMRNKWASTVEECHLGGNVWVDELYNKKEIWCTAYIKGKFFAGLMTTSRCEGLHSQIGKYVKSRNNLREFMENFKQCVDNIRNNEKEMNFKSSYGHVVPVSHAFELEKFAAMCSRRPKQWNVSLEPTKMEICCSCLAMESFGLPCPHIVAVLVSLQVDYLPSCLLLSRWTKLAKGGYKEYDNEMIRNTDERSLRRSWFGLLCESGRLVFQLACQSYHEVCNVREILTREMQQLKRKYGHEESDSTNYIISDSGGIDADNPIAKTNNTVGTCSGVVGRKRKRVTRCGYCKVVGHSQRGFDCSNTIPVEGEES
ncbi:protein FAR1-RELATED SEQUENCE 4-like [Abrus precatorius]|uniref:Protein FAR1-RELATED SEQUENCE 4-like n=1 Tax=Abrus precatorius TaxID=3816 RepID=A0A8B8M7P2_ABRPR|nr:protein FAR1-RELATED SEQUENCE 4-like [Abrus precatorius]